MLKLSVDADVDSRHVGLGAVAGSPVRLMFVLKDADLFSIRFR